MSTQQKETSTRRRPAAFNAVQPRQLLFLGVALIIIALQLLAMDWLATAQVDRGQARESQHLALKAEKLQRAEAGTATASVSSDGAQTPQGVSTVSYSPER